jgi:hypothetical protein
VSAQQQGDAQELSRSSVLLDGFLVPLLQRIRRSLSAFRASMMERIRRIVYLLEVGAEDCALTQHSQRMSACTDTQAFRTSLPVSRVTNELRHSVQSEAQAYAQHDPVSCSSSCREPFKVVEGTIISINEIEGNHAHWDMQVLDTNNYVTADGTIHHNSGKSVYSIVAKIVRLCATQTKGQDGKRRSRWAIIRNTNQQLTDTTLKTWREWVHEGPMGTWHETHRTWYLRFNDVEAEIMFRALDKPGDLGKLLSMELTGAFINEAREVPFSLLGDIYDRTRRYPNPRRTPSNWYGLIGDTNGPVDGSPLQTLIESSSKPGSDVSLTKYNDEYTRIETRASGILMPYAPGEDKSFTQIFWQPSGVSPVAENLDNLAAGYYHDMIRRPSTSPDGVDVSVHAKYAVSVSGTPVFKESYDPSVHESKVPLNPIAGHPILAGMDFGRDPSLVFGQFDDAGKFRVLRELIRNNMTLQRFLPILKSFVLDNFGSETLAICGDPAGEQRSGLVDTTAYNMLRDAGWNILLPPNGKGNRIGERLAAVEYFLCSRIPGMLIDPSCTVVKRGFRGGYRYSTDNAPTPVKDQYSHPMDATQYLCQYAMCGRLPTSRSDFIPSFDEYSSGPVVADRIMGY